MTLSRDGDPYIGSQLKTLEDPWRSAVQELENKVKRDFDNVEKIDTLSEVLDLATSKRQSYYNDKKNWSYKKRNGKVVYFHEYYAKIVAGLQRFKEIGDTIVQYDPAHAALPWAAVRFFLQTTITRHEIDTTMLEGIATVSDLIAHYRLVEQRYLQGLTPATESREALSKALAKLYASILTFLSRACRHYKQSAAERIRKSIFSGTPAAIDELFKRMAEQQSDVDRRLDLVNRDDNTADQVDRRDDANEVKLALDELQYKHQELLDIASGFRDAFTHAKQHDQAAELVNWLDNIPYYQHHDAAKRGRLVDSGRWLEERIEYRDWWSWKTSAMFWLTGTLGMGKTALVSNVIDTLTQGLTQSTDPALLAYFYISKNPSETFRTDPVKILRCLVQQLAVANASNVNGKLLTVYESSKATYGEPRKLTFDQCVELLTSLTDTLPLILIIDALDEMPVDHLNELLRGLGDLTKNAARQIKIFVSSRNDLNTVSHLKAAKNFHLSIKPSDNHHDIDRFVRQEVQAHIDDGALLGTSTTDPLKEEVITVLLERAQGMFRYVAMQMSSLFDPNQKYLSPDDVREELQKPAKDLDDEYVSALKRIDQATNTRRTVASRALMWLLCSQRLLPAGELHLAVAVDKNGTQISLQSLNWEEIVGMCYSMVSFDIGQNVFRFAHASVPDFLETRQEYSQSLRHAEVARRCFEVLLNRHQFSKDRNGSKPEYQGLLRYAMVFWPVHYMNVQPLDRNVDLKDNMKSLLFRGHEGSRFFKQWLQDVQEESIMSGINGEIRRRLLWSDSPSATPLFIASIFKMPEALIHIKKCLPRFNFQQRNAQGRSALDLAIEYGHEDVVKFLLEAGVEINSFNVEATAQFEDIQISGDIPEVLHFISPLQAAAASDSPSLVDLLLDYGARNIIGGYFGDALQAAALSGNIQTVKRLLSLSIDNPSSGFEVNSQCGFHGNVLQAAAANGHDQIVSLLIDEGADVNSRGGHYGHALIASLHAKHDEAVIVLLRSGANANAVSKKYGSAVQLACSSNSERVLESVLEKGASSEGLKAENPYLLHHAARNDLVYLADFLIRRDYDIELTDGTPNQPHWTPLMAAARYRSEGVLQLLLDAGADVFALDGDGASPIQLAAEKVGVSTVERLLKHATVVQKHLVKDLINQARHHNDWTALREVVQLDNLDMVKILVEAGATLAPDKSGVTPLHHAATKGYLSILQFFLSRCTDINLALALNLRNKWGKTPLTDAVQAGHTKVVKALIDHGGSLFYEDNKTRMPLEIAARYDFVDIANLFLNMSDAKKKKSHFSTTHRTREGFTALQFAAKHNARRVLEVLVEQDCDCRPNNGGWNALHEATEFKHREIVEILLKAVDKGTHVKNLDINLKRPKGLTPLNTAARDGDLAMVQSFLSRNCTFEGNEAQNNPIHHAAEGGHLEVLESLLAMPEAKRLINAQNRHKYTALFIASRKDHLDVVKLLLNRGADHMLQSENGETCLHAAVSSDPGLIRLLLTQAREENNLESFLDLRKTTDRTALHCAIEAKYPDIPQLLSFGASYKAKTHDGVTPLHCAAWDGYAQAAEDLLHAAEKAGDFEFVNTFNDYSKTPLIDAAQRGNYKLVEILLHHGADIIRCDKVGQNALHYSAWRNRKEVVELLLQTASARGSTVLKKLLDQQNKVGRNALLDMGMQGYSDILQMLLDYGSDWAVVGSGSDGDRTVLNYAAENGRLQAIQSIAKVALASGDVRKVREWVMRRPKNGSTALEWAVYKRNYQIQDEIHNILDKCR